MATPLLRQENRLMELTTPLPANAVVINGISGSESISGLYRFKLDLLASQGPEFTDVMGLLGKPVGVSLQTYDKPRHFHGVVSRIATGSREKGFWHYTAEVVPWLWLLTQRAGCRIFQNLTVPEILKKIFDEYKDDYSDVVDYDDATTAGKHISLDYCVQYRETDFNFVSRLMEQEGIYYYFRHAGNSHQLVFTDNDSLLDHIPGKSTIQYQPDQGYAEREDVISRWERQYEVRSGKYSLRAHHFELPGKNLEMNDGNGFLELYDYPGEYASRFNKPEQRLDKIFSEGEKLNKIRLQEEDLPRVVFEGSSNCRTFSPAHIFNMDGRNLSSLILSPKDNLTVALVNEFVLTSVTFSITQTPDYISGHQTTASPYHNNFVCVRTRDAGLGASIRPRRLTPKPVTAGPQTAVVTVPKGEESWLDKYGRVHVQFHWDRDGKNDADSSCWIRVAQPWAGASWGAHFWPRIGQEVVVEFLEGDPDQPIITGSLYNAANMPPYKLPDNYTRSGIITRSSKDGKSKNFNELRFEDKAGGEQLFMNAERDMDHRVEHDMREFVGNNQHLIVGSSQMQSIGGNKHEHVKKDHVETIDQDASRTVKGEHMEKVSGDYSISVGGDSKEKVTGKISVKAANHHEKLDQAYAIEAGQQIHVKSGMTLVIESGVQLSLKVGGNFIDIGPTGVCIQGTMVMINSGGAAGSGSGASPSDPKEPKEPDAPQTADDGSKGGAL
ncbi:MAG: type VI secretion system tip protein VgrG [Acidobacteria bacterium]|nr:MAG: type VI secretion system tip protein VgrG [Acidobacteriota bacterium]